eukprot:GHVH01016879.1.p1 GENE.GHVH01016879.1~~GHVH01016879.1.p1  ORF type:complete len:256 (+),score=36.72 GHVH01016879.1:123-890(+)
MSIEADDDDVVHMTPYELRDFLNIERESKRYFEMNALRAQNQTLIRKCTDLYGPPFTAAMVCDTIIETPPLVEEVLRGLMIKHRFAPYEVEQLVEALHDAEKISRKDWWCINFCLNRFTAVSARAVFESFRKGSFDMCFDRSYNILKVFEMKLDKDIDLEFILRNGLYFFEKMPPRKVVKRAKHAGFDEVVVSDLFDRMSRYGVKSEQTWIISLCVLSSKMLLFQAVVEYYDRRSRTPIKGLSSPPEPRIKFTPR